MTRSLLVTGASTGFGRAIALASRDRGDETFGTVRSARDAESLQAEGVIPVLLDVTRAETLAPAVEAVLTRTGGRLDALVNNAGTTWPGPVELMALADLRAQFEVNVVGQVAVTQAFLPALRAAGGHVVFISSDSARLTPPLLGAYAASKRALEALAEALAQETAGQGVRVSVLAPGAYETAIWGTSRPRGDAYLADPGPVARQYRALGARLLALSAAQPKGRPEDLAARVLQLLADPAPPFLVRVPWRSGALVALRGLVPDRLFHRLVLKLLGASGTLPPWCVVKTRD